LSRDFLFSRRTQICAQFADPGKRELSAVATHFVAEQMALVLLERLWDH
jgi:hypothetical protein